ncbi:MAG TPA: HD domain-containing protein [Ktedonobacteraceae bacterium]|nr:HD domain-containing protein [Ktedonobacteraceae bacterium]
MNNENASSEILPLLQQVAQFFSAHERRAFLVGGSVRDLLLHVPCVDWDIATDGDAPRLARELADTLGGYYAYMNDKACRITIKQQQPTMEHGEAQEVVESRETVLDIAPLHGDSIEADLRLRDFTLNALAVPLSDLVPHLAAGMPLPLIDPLHGADDLAAQRLHAVSDASFQQDPLRMLRAVRFMHRYQLTLEPQSEAMLVRDAPLLFRAAPERVHDELYAILSPAGAVERLRFLDSHELFTVLFPEFAPARGMQQPGLHHWDVLEHSLEAVGCLERLAALLQASPLESDLLAEQGDIVGIRELLTEAELQGIFRRVDLLSAPMKLAALLHDIGKTITCTTDEDGHIHFYGHPQAGIPLAQHITRRLSASTRDSRLVQQVVAHHMRPGQLSHDTLTPRAIRRYFVDLGPVGINVALISLADHLAMRGPNPLGTAWERHLATVCQLLTAYIRERKRLLPPRLLQGDELMHRLRIAPGPLVGYLLDQIAEAQAEGTIHSKEEALWLAQERLARRDT